MRLRLIEAGLMLGAIAVLVRCAQLQILEGGMYRLLATDQHELQKLLVPERGKILVRDRTDGSLHPIATNRDSWTLYAVPKEMGKEAGVVAREIAPYTGKTEAELAERWAAKPESLYDPLAKGLTTTDADAIKAKNLKGIGLVKGWARVYPETDAGGQLVGFVRTDDTGIGAGAYGIEGSLDDVLAGSPGFVLAQKDAGGRRLMLSGGNIREAVDGSDVVLTIDRTIQYEACARLKKAVEQVGGEGGSVVIMDPKTGAVVAMCSVPDFDPGTYGKTSDISTFNNPVTLSTYEPGSVFKAFTMALGVDAGKVGPNTTYEDTGVVKIDRFEIKNSDKAAHGMQTMTQVLELSLNTGSIFVERLLGIDAFRNGIQAFGFGEKTGIELSPEAKGNVSSLSKKSDVYGATASFGQGITATPIQLAAAFSAIANGGKLMRPYIVDEIIRPDGSHERTKPVVVRRPISERTSELVRGMLVSVIEHGHGAHAAIPGYYVAGKTGTAQVADPRGGGYLQGVTMATFAGFVPADDPAFVMIIRISKPKGGAWAESSAAPLFGDLGSFVLAYLGVPTERKVAAVKDEEVPTLPPPNETPSIVSVTGGEGSTQAGTNSGNGVGNGHSATGTKEGSATSSSP